MNAGLLGQPGQASPYMTSGPLYDVIYHALEDHVAERGGTIVDPASTRAAIQFLRSRNLFGSLVACYGASYGVKLNGTAVQEIYNLACPKTCGGFSRMKGGASDPSMNLTGLGGLPAFNFVAASAQKFEVDTLDKNPRALTLTVVVRTPAAAATRVIYGHRSEAANPLISFMYSTTGFRAQIRSLAGSDLVDISAGSISVNTNYVVTWRLDVAGNLHVIRVNGTQIVSSSQSFGANTFLQNFQTIGGQYQPALGSTFEGFLAEIFYFGKAIGNTEILELERYLGAKYGISVA